MEIKVNTPANKEEIISYNQDTDDIISAILYADENNPKLSYNNAVVFLGEDDYQTGANIFNYIKENIYYKAEPDSLQTTKTVERLLYDKQGDCKHYSLFAGSVLKTLNIPYAYRFVSFGSKDDIQHVYIVINPDTNPIYLDAVIDEYDTQEKFSYCEDYYPNTNKSIGKSKFFTLDQLDIQTTTAQEGIDYNIISHTTDYSSFALLMHFNFLNSDESTKLKKGKHVVNKVILALGRAAARGLIMDVESFKPVKQSMCSFYIMSGIRNYNPTLFNQLVIRFNTFSSPEIYLNGWYECWSFWYNLGGKQETDREGLIGDIAAHSEDYILGGVNWKELTIDMPLGFGGWTLSTYLENKFEGDMPQSLGELINFTEEDFLEFLNLNPNWANPSSIMGKQIGDVFTAAQITAIVVALCEVLAAVLGLIGIIKSINASIELGQQQSDDNQELIDAYNDLTFAIENNEDLSTYFGGDGKDEVSAYIEPLGIAAFVFGAVIYFESDIK